MDAPLTRHFIIATAGHVDHGKSALIKALTGTDPDRLPEEKARGITIDLGFAHLRLPAVKSGDPAFDLGIVDVPGHEDFVKNMVAGAGSIDLALLVVAADDGWMPQTEEHLQIFSYLGVERAVIALTKIDLAGPQEDECIARLRQQLRGSPFERSPLIPTSIVSGRGLDELKGALVQELASVPPPCDLGKPRLPIDRAFTLQGIGTVVTGTLRGGCLHAGQEVIIQPGTTLTRIRTIQTHNREVPTAGPGTRTALNLPNIPLHADRGAGDRPVRRGSVLTLPNLGHAHDVCDLLLERSSRLAPGSIAAHPLQDGMRVRFHTGSANVPGRLYLSGPTGLAPGERGLAQIRLEAPVYAFMGDRFVLRDWTERLTLAGGLVLEPVASRKLRPAGAWQFLLARPEPLTPQLATAAQLQSHPPVHRSTLLVQSNFSPAQIAQALSQLNAAGQCIVLGEFVVEASDWKLLRERAQTLIDACHHTHPEQPGLSLAELRSALTPGRALRPGAPPDRPLFTQQPGGSRKASHSSVYLASPDLFEPLVADLCRSGFSSSGSVIRRATFRPTLPASLQLAGGRIRSVLSSKPLEPPSRKELGPDAPSRDALGFLVRAGEVIELAPDLVLSAAAFHQACAKVRQFLSQHGSATVSELRQALGASRRIVVPLLEKLDREGLTRREGDQRFLKAPADSNL